MKTSTLFILVLVSNSLFGQYFIRTKKNFGVFSNYNFGEINGNPAPSFQLGVCRQFGSYVIPEVGLTFRNCDEIYSFAGINAALQFRKRALKLYVRKRGAKCKMELLDVFAAPELFAIQPKFTRPAFPNHSFALRYGLALHHFESGGSRRNKAWNVKLEVYHRNYFNAIQPIKHEFGIALRVLHFRTYDFLK
jgi:hypothetical protein